MKDYEKEFMRKIYKEIKLMQEKEKQKELIKLRISWYIINICYIILYTFYLNNKYIILIILF